jgi:hypothetical protein
MKRATLQIKGNFVFLEKELSLHKRYTYFMLVITAYTFIGLSTLQNISYFTDWMGDVKITLSITASEEESETSNSSEVKEVKEVFHNERNKFALEQYNTILNLELTNHKNIPEEAFCEVLTPPPERLIG